MREKCAVTLASILAVTAGPSKSADAVPSIETRIATSAGPVRGSVNPTTITYLGIPYAEPPIGALRWRPPQPRHRSQTVVDATQFGGHCVQPPPGSTRSQQSEDCLFLNIYLPRRLLQSPSFTKLSKHLPVIVWIHGGGNGVGAGDSYDPTPMVEDGDGVVAVTLNYRLGVLGFLAHPALDAEDHPAVNYGILDQQLALKWVRDNITRFGGDADNVTIVGESAGGLNVITHLISPLSAGLFHRAIVQSGGYGLDTPNLADSESMGVAFAERAGCSQQTAACLRELTAAKILAHTADPGAGGAYNQATVDGRIIVESQRAALQSGRFNRIAVLQGSNSQEGRAFTSKTLTATKHEKALVAAMERTGKDSARALAIYSLEHYGSAYEAASAAGGDRFACGALESNRLLSKWVTTYAYEFADSAASEFGAAHGAELKYLFNVKYDSLNTAIAAAVSGGPNALPAASQVLARQMRMAWMQFASSGSPQTGEMRKWPLASKGIQTLKSSSAGAIPTPEFSARYHCDFWN